jgi:hypothetical protein
VRIPLVECPACRELHPIRFDPHAGDRGDQVWVCHEMGRMELAEEPLARLRDVIIVQVVNRE